MAVYTQIGIRAGEMLCPQCQSKGSIRKDEWSCQSCHASFQFQVLCNECSNSVKRLKVCGGFEEYYCDTCRTPVSKYKVVYQLLS